MKNSILNFCSTGILGIMLLSAIFPSCTIDRLPGAKSCTLSVGDELIVAQDEARYPITVTSDRAWSMFSVTDPVPDWCVFDATSGPAGSTTIYVSVEQNPDDADARQGVFQFHAGADGAVLTLVQRGSPKITTQPMNPGNIDEDLGLLEGVLDYSNLREVEVFGFQYRKAGAATWEFVPAAIRTGAYSYALTGLSSSTEYEYRAYMKTGAGKEYLGSIESFTTFGEAQLVSVDQIRAMTGSSVTGSYKIEAVVVSDTTAGNFPGRSPEGTIRYQVVDKNHPAEPNMGMMVVVPASTTAYNKGDVLVVKVTAARLGSYILGNYGFISRAVTVQPVKISKTGTQNVDPVVIARDQMANYQSQLVTIQHAQLTSEFINEAAYPSLSGTKELEIEGNTNPVSLIVHGGASFAGNIPPRGSGSVTGIAGGTENSYIQAIMPRQESDIAISNATADRFSSPLSFRAYAVEAPNMIVGTALSGYQVTIRYLNGRAGEIISGPISVEIEGVDGADASGLAAVAQASFTPSAYGEGEIKITVNGTMTSAGTVRFTVTGLDTYWLSGADKSVLVRAFATPTDANYSTAWALPTENPNGDNTLPSTMGDLGVLSSGQGVSASAFSLTGFNKGAANYGNTWGGSIPAGNNISSPATFMGASITTPANRTASLYEFKARMRKNNADELDVYLQYSVDGGSFRTAGVIALPGGNSNTDQTFSLFTVAGLQDLPGGTTVHLRIVPVSKTNNPAVVFVFGNAINPTLTGKVE